MKLTAEQKKRYYAWPYWLMWIPVIPAVYFSLVSENETLFIISLITLFALGFWNYTRLEKIKGKEQRFEKRIVIEVAQLLALFLCVAAILDTWEKAMIYSGMYWGFFGGALLGCIFFGERVRRVLNSRLKEVKNGRGK